MVSLFSYNGQMTITLLANESVIPTQKDAEKVLREYFLDEFTLSSHLEDDAQSG